MLKKGMVLISTIGLALLANLFLAVPAVQGLEVNDNGCFVFNDRQPICPDKYCLPGMASCSNDGNRCYCKTRTLANSSKNKSCEVIFGSKMVYETNNGNHTVYLYGGIWSQIATLAPNSQHLKQINGELAIVFKQAYGKVYRTSFLTDLYKSVEISKAINNAKNKGATLDPGLDIMIAIDVDIDQITGVGYVSNPRYEIGDPKSNPATSSQNTSCAHRQTGDNPFFLKYSALNRDPYDDNDNFNPCTFPSYIISLAIFGREHRLWFATPPKIPLTKNCTTNTKNFFFKDHTDIHLMVANAITPQGEKRKVYLMRPENFLLGEIFDGKNHQEKLQRVRRFCNQSDLCQGDTQSPGCKLCNSKILDKLDNNSGKTLSQIAQELLIKQDQAGCDVVDTGADFAPNDQSNNSNNIPKSDEEKSLDKQLPAGIVNICDQNQPSSANRLKCKKFSLKCYIDNLSEIEPVSMCDQLTGQLTSSRWMICASTNLLSSGASKSGKFLDGFFRLNSSDFFRNNTFLQAWSVSKNICNILLVLVMMWIIFSQVTGYGLSNYSIKKMLPKLIVAIILINLSMILSQLAIDLSNIAGRGLFLLFDDFAKALKISGLSKVSFSTIALSTLSSTGLFLILGGLVLLLPVLVVIIIGMLFVAILLSIRHALVVILILSMPFAIIAGILANTQRLFQFWAKNFFNILIIYPIVGLMFGSGKFIKILLLAVAKGNANLQLVALAVPILLTSATPFVMLMITKGLGALNSFLQKSMRWSMTTGQQVARNSDFNQAVKANQEHFWLRSKFIDKTLGNRTLNNAFLGAGNSALRRRVQKRASIQNLYKDIVNSDTALLNAFHANGGVASGQSYNSLNQNQQERYRQLASLGAFKDSGFYETSLKILASEGGGLSNDCSELSTILDNAQKHHVETAALVSSLIVASKIAEKAGNSFTSGVMGYAKKQIEEQIEKQNKRQDKDQSKDQTETATSSDPQMQKPPQSQDIKIDFTSDSAKNSITNEIKKALGKVPPSKFNDADFFHEISNADNTKTRIPNLALEAVKDRIKDSKDKNSGKVDLKSSYISVIGNYYSQIPLGIRSTIDPVIIETVNDAFSTNNNLPETNFATAEEALIVADLLTRTIGGKIR